MKTTIEISDPLLEKARAAAAREGRTLRAIIEEALVEKLRARSRTPAFRMRRASFRGDGLQLGFADGSWEEIRDAAYEGRGG
jgi:hypothetical protein